MPDYYAPDGTPIDMWTWAAMLQDRSDQPHYVSIVRGGVPWREQKVSTVWLGLDHSFGGRMPLTWETLVFPECTFMLRYPSHELAWLGHQMTVAIMRARCEGHRWNAGQMKAR